MNIEYEKIEKKETFRIRGFLLADNALNKRMFYLPALLDVAGSINACAP